MLRARPVYLYERPCACALSCPAPCAPLCAFYAFPAHMLPASLPRPLCVHLGASLCLAAVLLPCPASAHSPFVPMSCAARAHSLHLRAPPLTPATPTHNFAGARHFTEVDSCKCITMRVSASDCRPCLQPSSLGEGGTPHRSSPRASLTTNCLTSVSHTCTLTPMATIHEPIPAERELADRWRAEAIREIALMEEDPDVAAALGLAPCGLEALCWNTHWDLALAFRVLTLLGVSPEI